MAITIPAVLENGKWLHEKQSVMRISVYSGESEFAQQNNLLV